MPKPIIRYVSARPDIMGPLVGTIMHRGVHLKRHYIDQVTDLKFNDKGELIRFETDSAIYVQVKE